MSDRVRNILAALFVALGISLVIHFVLFVVVASGGNLSFLGRAAEVMLTPAGAITEHILPGHTLAQIVCDFVISVLLYMLVLWPVVVVVRVRRGRV